jgi:hypothetical protein
MIPICAGPTPWHLYTSYPTPGGNPRGFEALSSRGYVIQDGPSPYVYYIRIPSGQTISSFPAPGGPGAWGISWDSVAGGNGFFVSNAVTSWIYDVDLTGSVISPFLCPVAGPADMEVRWYQGSLYYLYVAVPDQNIIAIVNQTTGSLVSTLPGPGGRPTACGGYSAFFVTDVATHAVYEDGVPVIKGIEMPTGFSYTAITGRIWEDTVSIVDDATDRIYLYRNATEVAPASLGRVKALFR